MRDLTAEQELRDRQEAVFAGTADEEDYAEAVLDYIGTRNSKLYIRAAVRHKFIIGACALYVAIVAYGKFHYLLPWHVS